MPTLLHLGFGQNTSPMTSTDELSTDFKTFPFNLRLSFFYQEPANKTAVVVLLEGFVLL